jgi:hypothetical protein
MIEDGQSVTLGYTLGYLLIGPYTIRLYDCVVQAPGWRIKAIGLKYAGLGDT